MNSQELEQYRERLAELIKPEYEAAKSYDKLATKISRKIGEDSPASQTLSNWGNKKITRGLSDSSLEKLGLYFEFSTDRAEARELLRAHLEGRDPAAKSLSLQSLQEQFEALAKRVAVLEAAIAADTKPAIADLIEQWLSETPEQAKQAQLDVCQLSQSDLEEIQLGRSITIQELLALQDILQQDISALVMFEPEKQKNQDAKLAIAQRRTQTTVRSQRPMKTG